MSPRLELVRGESVQPLYEPPNEIKTIEYLHSLSIKEVSRGGHAVAYILTIYGASPYDTSTRALVIKE